MLNYILMIETYFFIYLTFFYITFIIRLYLLKYIPQHWNITFGKMQYRIYS